MLLDDERTDLAAGRDGKADRAVAGFDLHHQRAEHVDAERLPALAVLGVARHRRRDVVVDPVAFALVVVIGAAAAHGKGADVADGGHAHGRLLRVRRESEN
jgi:hypothetical protein